MTDQVSYGLVVEHPRFSLAGYKLYAVIRGAPVNGTAGWGEGPVRLPDPRSRDKKGRWVEPRVCRTNNWEGYTPVFRLRVDGRMLLEEYRYDDDAWPTRRLNHVLDGDFWAVFKRSFDAPRLYVPFRAGCLANDTRGWIVEVRDDSASTCVFLRGFSQ